MKKNIIWIFMLFFIAALTLILFFIQKPNKLSFTPLISAPTNSNAVVTQTNNHQSGHVETAAVTTNEAINTPNSASNSPGQLTAKEKNQVWVDSKNLEIGFYGKVMDQDGNLLPGVKMKVDVRQWQMSPLNPQNISGKMIAIEQESGADGRININGIKGDGFDIEYVQKTGYSLSPKTPHGFGPGSGTRENPVIIKMWKLGDPQQLISHHLTRIGIPVDGQPVQFDLFNGKKIASGGQLIVRLKRDPQILPPGNARYDWSLELEIPHGGLVINNDEFMYQAPDSGYQETFKFDMPKDADNWTKSLDQQFYIQLDDGKQFGSLVVHLWTIHDTPPLGISLDITLNPNGSKSLQP